MRCSFSLLCCALMPGLFLPLHSSDAAMINADSNGYGLLVDALALGLSVNAGPLPNGASGTAPAPYNVSDNVVNVSVTGNIPLLVTAQVAANAVNGTATSNVDGLPGPRTSTASGGVAGAEIEANTIPFLGGGITLLGINATLDSTAQITGDFGSLAATGTTTIQDLGLVINAIPVDLSAFVGVNVTPNTGVNLALLGIANSSLILNEQIIASNQSSIIVNAFHLTVNLVNLVTAEVILGHSEVEVEVGAVPEPATIALVGLGFVLMTPFVRSVRRRQRGRAHPAMSRHSLDSLNHLGGSS